jgi:hypothetical protein
MCCLRRNKDGADADVSILGFGAVNSDSAVFKPNALDDTFKVETDLGVLWALTVRLGSGPSSAMTAESSTPSRSIHDEVPPVEIRYSEIDRSDLRVNVEDFSFSSMSFDVDGAIELTRFPSGWVIGSVSTPEARSASMSWRDLDGEMSPSAPLCYLLRPRRVLGQGPGKVVHAV